MRQRRSRPHRRLDLYTWLTYRCFSAKGEERVPLFGEFGLVNQLGIGAYARPRKFREQIEQWLILVKTMWPECPARVSSDGGALIVNRANAIISGRTLGYQGEAASHTTSGSAGPRR